MTRERGPHPGAAARLPGPESATRAGRGPWEPELVWTSVEIAAWRARAYRLFAALFLYPEEHRLQQQRASAAQLRFYDEALSALPLFAAWQRLLATLETLDPHRVDDLHVEHVRLFTLDPAGRPCVPYEAAYLPEGQASWLSVQLRRTYAREGLDLAPSQNRGPDHASVELEFMAYLCQREAEAWQSRDLPRGLGLLARQRSFLRSHLHRWFGAFALRVRAEATLALYAVAAEAADAFVYHDLDLVGSLLHSVRLLPIEPNPART